MHPSTQEGDHVIHLDLMIRQAQHELQHLMLTPSNHISVEVEKNQRGQDRRAFVPEFSNALVGLKKGETTKTPVKTQFGYHIIRLDDTRKPKIPPLDSVRGEIAKQLQQQRVRDAIAAARAGAKIE